MCLIPGIETEMLHTKLYQMGVLDERETAGTALESLKIVQVTYLLINEHFPKTAGVPASAFGRRKK